jgi:peptide/nickel transport system permease protein
MLAYIIRRLGIGVIILFGSSFILYNMAAYSGDPLEELRLSQDPKAQQLIFALTRDLNLDVPPPLRYFIWLRGVLTLDFGSTRDAREVSDALALAIPTSFRLVIASTIIAIILGIGLGIITALRQYSRFDYSMTFVAFLLFSLPIFWVAVLLKQYLAISFNDFLFDPLTGDPGGNIGIVWMVLASLFAGLITGSVSGGDRKRYWTLFGSAAVVTFGVFFFLDATRWFTDPYLGPVGLLIFGVGIAFGITQLSVGVSNKPALYASLTMAGLGFLTWFPMQVVFEWPNRKVLYPALLVLTILIAIATSYYFAKVDRRAVVRTTVITAVLISIVMFFDRMLHSFSAYARTDAVNFRPVPTTGQTNALLERNNFWFNMLDVALHLVLPTLALLLISFAGYVRFSRGTMLEVLNQDYIRTARAKGLPERTVIMRHAFRNTLIPIATIMVGDIVGVIGGAIITERVFGWFGMGTLFNQAIGTFDLNLLMGVGLLGAALAVLANLIADLLYATLDPRIRVGAGK